MPKTRIVKFSKDLSPVSTGKVKEKKTRLESFQICMKNYMRAVQPLCKGMKCEECGVPDKMCGVLNPKKEIKDLTEKQRKIYESMKSYEINFKTLPKPIQFLDNLPKQAYHIHAEQLTCIRPERIERDPDSKVHIVAFNGNKYLSEECYALLADAVKVLRYRGWD